MKNRPRKRESSVQKDVDARAACVRKEGVFGGREAGARIIEAKGGLR